MRRVYVNNGSEDNNDYDSSKRNGAGFLLNKKSNIGNRDNNEDNTNITNRKNNRSTNKVNKNNDDENDNKNDNNDRKSTRILVRRNRNLDNNNDTNNSNNNNRNIVNRNTIGDISDVKGSEWIERALDLLSEKNTLYQLSTLLPSGVKNKIHVRKDLSSLENLYVTKADGLKLKEMVELGVQSPQLSPAYSLAHMDDLIQDTMGMMGNNVLVRHAGRYILNPRLFYLLNTKFKSINERYARFNMQIDILFREESYTKTYLLYYENDSRTPYKIPSLIIKIKIENTEKEIEPDKNFNNVITELIYGIEDKTEIEKRITKLKQKREEYRDNNYSEFLKCNIELRKLENVIREYNFRNDAVKAIKTSLNNVATKWQPTGRLKKDNEFAKYRSEGIMFYAVDESMISTLSTNSRAKDHIIVGLHITKEEDNSYTFNLIGNMLSRITNLYVDREDHLVLERK